MKRSLHQRGIPQSLARQTGWRENPNNPTGQDATQEHVIMLELFDNSTLTHAQSSLYTIEEQLS